MSLPISEHFLYFTPNTQIYSKSILRNGVFISFFKTRLHASYQCVHSNRNGQNCSRPYKNNQRIQLQKNCILAPLKYTILILLNYYEQLLGFAVWNKFESQNFVKCQLFMIFFRLFLHFKILDFNIN